jgi:signal transduction histidine kinase
MGPSEVVSVGRVLNDLGTRVESMLKEERELGADLSHRLRTPVTALRLDVESLSDPAERTLMSGHVEALAAAVDEAVSLAREGRAEGPRECDVDRVVRLRGAFWSILAREAGRPFTLVTPGYPMPTRIPANRLGAAIDALLDNVFQHTPDGTELSLRLIDEGERFRLVVADDGPGMVAGHSERGTSGAGSTGIGMDVARRAARDADGELVVRSSSGGGTSVELRLTPSRNLNRPMQHT